MPQQRVKRTGTTRERTGCLTCRRRKKKCDLRQPCCTHCHRLNFRCEWETPRTVTSPKLAPLHSRSLTPGQSSAQDSPLTREAVRYYVQQFTRLLSATRDNDCFLSVFLPMAFEYPSLHSTVVAWAAAHLAIRNPTPALELFDLESRATALSALSTNLAGPSRSSEAGLACCLVLCSLDSIVGDTSSWDLHLQGAAEILRPALSNDAHTMKGFLSSFDGRWLLRNFAYHDVLMSVTMDRAPLIPGYYWQDETSLTLADSYFGFASSLIFHIAEISSLKADKQLGIISEADFSDQIYGLESALIDWMCPATTDSALFALANMYRSAALLHLYRALCGRDQQMRHLYHDKAQEQVDAIVEHMSSMPSNSLAECTTLFPIFMCGAETDRPHHVQIIRDRLSSILTSRGFKNIENAMSVLDELWASRGMDAGNGGVQPTELMDWTDVLQSRGWKLSLS